MKRVRELQPGDQILWRAPGTRATVLSVCPYDGPLDLPGYMIVETDHGAIAMDPDSEEETL